MINEIKRRLSNDEIIDLGCIDEQSFINKSTRINTEILNQGSLRVDYIDIYNHVHLKGEISCGFNFIYFNELEYFEIKDKDQKPTFDDLIDVTVQAIKDGVLPNKVIKISDFLIEINIDGKDRLFNSVNAADGVDFIKTLYPETFVIEHQSDFSKINHNDNKTKIVLSNGELVNDDIWDMLKNYSGVVQLSILKGATVTKKRGSHD